MSAHLGRAALALLLLATALPAQDHILTNEVSRIAFGSCARENKPHPFWDVILDQNPDLFLFLGDNIYADTDDIEIMRRKYDQLAAKPGYQRLLDRCEVLATWDDHDYGRNDAGAEYEMKNQSAITFLDFYHVPTDSPRRKRPGIHGSYLFGPEGRRLQVLLLDTRFHRSPLERKSKRASGTGPYQPTTNTNLTLLGEAQWTWLEAQLRHPADVRVIASSIQVLSGEHGWETWGNFPHERERLYRLIREANARNIIFVSGDRHLGEISIDRSTPNRSEDFIDLTSSGLVNSGGGRPTEPNRHRAYPMYRKPNFGWIEIDWAKQEAALSIRSTQPGAAATIQHRAQLRGSQASAQ